MGVCVWWGLVENDGVLRLAEVSEVCLCVCVYVVVSGKWWGS